MEPSSGRPRARLGGVPHSARGRRSSGASPALRARAPGTCRVRTGGFPGHRRQHGPRVPGSPRAPSLTVPGRRWGKRMGCRVLTGKTTRCYLLGALPGNGILSICVRHGANAWRSARGTQEGTPSGPRPRRGRCPWASAARGLGSRAPWPRPAVRHAPFPGPASLGRSEAPGLRVLGRCRHCRL